MKNRIFLALGGATLCLFACKDIGGPKNPDKWSIQSIRALDPAKDKALFEKDITVEAFLVTQPVPFLLTDLKLLEINTPMPDSAYLPISGQLLEKLRGQDEEFHGALVRLKGRPVVRKTEFGRGYEIELICPEPPVILKKRLSELFVPHYFDICRIYPPICELPPVFKYREYALLYSGGVNSYNAHTRYWNDLSFMYNVLKNKYGYSDANIVVVYKDGTPVNASMTVDYAASPTGLTNAVNYLRTRMTTKDRLFVFVTNHGGGVLSGGSAAGGIADVSSDETDTYRYDETIYYYGQPVNEILDDYLTTQINSLSFNRMASVMEPCFSGGLQRDLRGAGRVNISAANEFEYSWGGGPGNHDIFSYWFTCALNKADHLGAALPSNPDTNGDNRISLLEAFLFAKLRDTAAEHPQLDDNGDGTTTGTPAAAPAGVDGVFASTYFL